MAKENPIPDFGFPINIYRCSFLLKAGVWQLPPFFYCYRYRLWL